MKRNIVSQIILWGIFLLAGCTNDEIENSSIEGNSILRVRIESQSASRTVVNELNEVLWTEKDQIGVFGNLGTSNTLFTLLSEANSTSAEFKGKLKIDETPSFAYYPYQADVAYENNTLSLTLPSEYTYVGTSNAPMIGMRGDDEEFLFKHLCGLLKVTINDIPEEASRFVITSEGEHSRGIAGSARVEDVTKDGAILEIEEGLGIHTITLNLVSNYFISSNVFYVPLPVGTYERLAVSLMDKDGNALLEKSISNVEIKRAVILEMPNANVEKGVTAQYVPIDWEQVIVSDFNPSTGDVALQFSNWVPDFKEGISAIVVPTETCSYIRIVEQVTKDGDSYILRTSEGNMTDIFMDTEFTLSTTPALNTRSASGSIQTQDAFGVIHPTQIIASMEDGTKKVLYDVRENIQSREAFLPISGTTSFLDFKWNRDGAVIKDWGDAKLFWDACNFNASLDGQFYFSFGSYIDLLDGELQIPKGDLLNFFYILSGTVDAALKLHLSAEKEYSVGLEHPLALMENILGSSGITIKFLVGSVPVSINVNSDIITDAQFNAEAKMDLTAGAKMDMNVKMGVEYIKDNPVKMISPIVSTNFTVYKPELTVEGTAHAEATVYPEIQISFFNFITTNIPHRKYLKDDFRFGGNVGGDGSNTFAGWDNRLYTTECVAADLSLDFAGKVLVESETLTWPADPEEIELYRAPYDIEIVSPEENTYFNLGEEIPIVVHVTDFSAYTQTPPNTLGAVVKFEVTNGKIDKEFAFTDLDGKATVRWVPKKVDDVLKASVLDAEGNTFESIEFIPNMQQPINVTTGEASNIADVNATLNGSISGRMPEGELSQVKYYPKCDF